MSNKKGLLPEDLNGKSVGTWPRFETDLHTITTAGEWEEIDVSGRVAEILLGGDDKFQFCHTDDAGAHGYPTYEVQLGVFHMAKVYVKGTYAGQDIHIVKGYL
jgi:hypothetical protein